MTLSIYDDALGGTFTAGDNVTPGDHMVKVYYRTHLIFWGQIITPVWDGSQNQVTLNCHDPTIRLKRHFHRYGDMVVGTRRDGGYPINGMGMRMLVLSALPTDRQESLGWPHPGIYFGFDSTTDFTGFDGPLESWPRPDDIQDWQTGDALWRTAERGTNVWESMTNLVQSAEGGFDMDFDPVDADKPPQTNLSASGDWESFDWEPGFYCQMNTWIKQGQDRTRTNEVDHEVTVDGVPQPYGARNVIFQYGFGRSNLDNFVFRPDASAMRNYAGVHYPGGRDQRGDRAKMAHVWVQESAARYGQYHEWQTSGQKDSKKIMKEKAKAITGAYGSRPSTTRSTLAPERAGGGIEGEEPYRFQDHFHVGDYATSEVKLGQFHQYIDGRIVKCNIAQQSEKHACVTTLELIPRVLTDIDEVTESQE